MVTAALKLPPGPRRALPGNPLFGFLAFRRDALGFLTQLAREYGDIVFFRMGPQRVYMLNHPDLIKDALVTHQDSFMKGRALQRSKRLLGEGLLTSEGEYHRRQRRLAQPAFHRQRIEAYGEVMLDYAARACAKWQDGATLDLSREMMRLTLAIVAKTLFDADVERDAEDVGAAFTEIMELFQMLMLPYSEYLEKLPLPATRKFERARARLDAVIYRIIEERRTQGADRGDLLSMLIAAQDTEGDGGRMSDEQLRDELMTLFLAGHETTANALTWTWYLLAQHPEVEQRLHAELDEVLNSREHFTVADYPRLRYTEMVVAEAMRLYPPAWVVGRLALKDFQAGEYVVPTGALVLISQYVVQRDPRFFPDPTCFDPERWTHEAREARPAYSYFPFGAGARRCIGEAFAWMEAVLLVATIAHEWRLRLAPNQLVEPQPRITLRPKHGIRMMVERRQRSER
ncbi:MAG: cytochrome P450 [Acidobacteria bacterium]|nr:MAG: cytochrome P450 [Acidobacteriota bacterium]